MEPGALGMTVIFGGAFFVGIWAIFLRKGADVNVRQGMSAEGLRNANNAPGFGRAKNEFDRKLALVEERRRRREAIENRLQTEESERIAKEESERIAKQVAEEREQAERERIAAEQEAERLRLEQEEEERLRLEQEEADRIAREEEEARLAEEREILRLKEIEDAEQERLAHEEEEARLAEEREILRQQEMADAEAVRLIEIDKAAELAELESREAAQRAMSELQERLAREGARSSDVQVSLMWNNYNDLDLHIVCPSGERIHGGNKLSNCGGELDVDANVRAETKKPVENVVWPEGKAPAGVYQVYVHHYKKHAKRRTRDPTKFQIIALNGGEAMEYNGALTHGDPIKLVCEFKVASPEERAAKKRELEEQILVANTLEEEEEEEEESDSDPEEQTIDAEPSEVADEVSESDSEGQPIAATTLTMTELQKRLKREDGRSSDVQVSLMWNNYNDLDLHVIPPSGEAIHGGNRSSECGGELDVDANEKAETKKPVENVVWPEGQAPAGVYQVYVNHYKKHAKRKAKDPTEFQVITSNGEDVMEYSGALTHGDPKKLVCEFTVASAGEEENAVDSNLGEIPGMPDLDELSEQLKD